MLNVSAVNRIYHAIVRNSVNGLCLGEPGVTGLICDLELTNTSVMHSNGRCLILVPLKGKAESIKTKVTFPL